MPLAEDELSPRGAWRTMLQTTFYSNGRKAVEVMLREGQKHGVEREWDPQGHLLRETSFVYGVQDGPDIRWYENGTMASRATYAFGRRQGPETTWRCQGAKWTEACYQRGILQGAVSRWDTQGHQLGYAAASVGLACQSTQARQR
jgi:antitoxin component YwqK of YwqJK toxin-antitoxin module